MAHGPRGGPAAAFTLDDISKAIIEQLQEDGRRSYAAIGKAVGLSEAAVRQRVQRLLDPGVMQIVAVTDPLQLGFPRQAMVGLTVDGDLREVADELAAMDEVDYVVVTAGSFDLLVEVVCEDDEHLLEMINNESARSRPCVHRNLRLSEATQTDLHLGYPMTVDSERAASSAPSSTCGCTSPGCRPTATADVPIIVRGEGPYVCDSNGKRYLDGLSGLFVVQAGHGRAELAEAAAKQAEELAFFPLWSLRAPGRDRARRAAGRARPRRPEPGLLHHRRRRGRRDRLEAGQAVLQADRRARRYKVISREHRLPRHLDGRAADHRPAGHQGTLRAAGARRRPGAEHQLLPRPGVRRRRRDRGFGRWAADQIERAILREGPETVAAVFLEPVQNSGGCFPPPPGYFQRVREICDKYGVLLVSDEVICAFGRLGY